MARGRTLGKTLRVALVSLTIGVLLGISPVLVIAADSHEPDDTPGEAALISIDGTEVAPQSFATSLSISGVVKDESGDPIEGAYVVAFYDSPLFPVWGYDYTGADGSYSIAGLTAGSYVVQAEADGYVTKYYDNVYDPYLATMVTSDRTDINFTLGPAGSISGVVKDEGGNPIYPALVNAQGDDFTGFDWTGADGTYSIDGLTPGNYLVWAEAEGYTTEYYDGVYDSSSATPVTVTALNDTSGIDFTLGTGVSEPPAVTANAATSVTVNSARLNGDLTSLGSAGNVTVSFEWGTTSGSLSNETTGQVETSTGTFYADLGGLSPSTTYYYRAKAVGDGTSYGTEKSFTTTTPTTPPSVTTSDATNIATTSARLNGNLTSLGTASSVTVSFVWGTSSGSLPNETTGQVKTSTGTFYFDLGSLVPGMKYYYQAKAVGNGTSYGAEKYFTTLTTPPSVATNDASAITTNSATLNGSLTSLGTASSVQVYFEWGLTTSYTGFTTPQTMTGTGAFSFDLSSLSQGTKYYYRAKAVGNGTSYGIERSFTTYAPSPSVTTNDATSITANSARLNGNLTWLGTAGSVTVSFVYGSTPGGPYPKETAGEVKASPGTFYFDLSGLSPGTTYYYRAKADGDGDPVYGEEKSFETPTAAPAVITVAASGAGNTSAILNGDLTSLGTSDNVTVSFEWGIQPGSYTQTTDNQTMTGTGTFYFELSGLIQGTTYYYRAKAVGNGEPVYGSDRFFSTTTSPSVTTNAATAAGNTSATLNGDLTSLGTADSVTVSFEWGTTSGSYPHETAGEVKTSTGPFDFDLGSLVPGTT